MEPCTSLVLLVLMRAALLWSQPFKSVMTPPAEVTAVMKAVASLPSQYDFGSISGHSLKTIYFIHIKYIQVDNILNYIC